MKCTLCGSEFDEVKAHATCQGCGFVKGCELVKCPCCGFENAPVPRWAKKLFWKKKRKKNGKSSNQSTLRLDELEVNQKVSVSFIQIEDKNALQKIIAMGVLPNSELILLQKFPSFVFQMGFSQFSIDKELASCIHVRYN